MRSGSSASIDEAVLPFLIASDAKLVNGKVVGDPTEGALLVLGAKAGLDTEVTREKFPRLATLPFDPTYKLMATFNSAKDCVRERRRALFRQRRGPGSDVPGGHRAGGRGQHAVRRRAEEAGGGRPAAHGGRRTPGDGRGLPGP